MMKFSVFFFLIISCFAAPRAWSGPISAGFWRFELKMSYGIVPVIINFQYKKKKLIGELINGNEIIDLKKISINKNQISIPVSHYEISMELKVESKTLVNGYLVRHNKSPKVETPLIGILSEQERFTVKKTAPTVDLGGQWTLTLEDEQENKTQAVAVLKQEGSKLSGSILTPTGDYRYLDGYVSGDEFEAASFDGVYNYLFKGKIKKDQLDGLLLSNSRTIISGYKNQKASLPDAYQATQIGELNFSFPDLNKKKISLNDKRFANKPVIVVIYGSWCPNCLDEMNYLIPWYQKNKNRGVEIIALAFERSLTEKEAVIQLKKTQKRYKIPYSLLLAGSTSQDKPNEKIPGLKNFISFPTTIFLDRKHQVHKVHAGFNGPSTGNFYSQWIEEFNLTMTTLLGMK